MREGTIAADPRAGGGDLSERTPLEGELVELEPVFAGLPGASGPTSG